MAARYSTGEEKDRATNAWDVPRLERLAVGEAQVSEGFFSDGGEAPS